MNTRSEFIERLGRPGTTVAAELVRTRLEGGGRVLDLKGMGTTDGRLPEHVLEAAERAVRNIREISSQGLASLREAISVKLKKENSIDADPSSEILVTTGAKQAIFVVMAAFLNPGDEVLMHAPNYVFDGSVQLQGALPRHIPTREADGFYLNLDHADVLVTPRTKMVILCNPVNPTGHLPSRAEVEAFGRFAERHDLLVVADESYEKYIFGAARMVSLASYREFRSRVVTIHSFSKSYSLAPFRLGYIAATPEVISVCRRVMEWINIYLNPVSQEAACAALTGAQDWVARMIGDWQKARDRFVSLLAEVPGLSYMPPEATGSVFLNIGPYGESSENVSRMLFEEYGIPSVAGSVFDGEGYIRLCFGGSPEIQKDAILRLKESLAKHRRTT